MEEKEERKMDDHSIEKAVALAVAENSVGVEPSNASDCKSDVIAPQNDDVGLDKSTDNRTLTGAAPQENGEKSELSEKSQKVIDGNSASPTALPSGEKSLREFLEIYLKSVAESERLKNELENVRKSNNFEELLKQPDFVQKAASVEAVEKAVIEKYLKKIAGGGAPVLLSGEVGKTPAVVPGQPKTLKEAKRLADAFFRG